MEDVVRKQKAEDIVDMILTSSWAPKPEREPEVLFSKSAMKNYYFLWDTSFSSLEN